MYMMSVLHVLFILLYMLFFYFLMNMGRTEDRNTGPFLVLCLVILFMLYTLRIYPLQINFNEKTFNSLKALGGCFFGYALTWFLYRVFKLERLRRFLLAMAGILACSEGAFLPLYNETGSPRMLWAVYGIMCCVAIVSATAFIIHLCRFRNFRHTNQKFVLIAFGILSLRAGGFMLYEGALLKPALPFYFERCHTSF